MSKPIRHALEGTLVLILALLLPATGQRRCPGLPRRAHAAPRTLSGLRLFARRAVVPALSEALVVRATSRVGKWTELTASLHDTGPLVRPYLVADERQQQTERRAALVLALEGIDIGPWVIHGHRIGTPAVSLGVAA